MGDPKYGIYSEAQNSIHLLAASNFDTVVKYQNYQGNDLSLQSISLEKHLEPSLLLVQFCWFLLRFNTPKSLSISTPKRGKLVLCFLSPLFLELNLYCNEFSFCNVCFYNPCTFLHSYIHILNNASTIVLPA